jgi:hypothetical protein
VVFSFNDLQVIVRTPRPRTLLVECDPRSNSSAIADDREEPAHLQATSNHATRPHPARSPTQPDLRRSGSYSVPSASAWRERGVNEEPTLHVDSPVLQQPLGKASADRECLGFTVQQHRPRAHRESLDVGQALCDRDSPK